ncbi:hypothetical protein ASPZODRAFT_131696 [Penicilliopsis zonata CBS 506.65]|uniref:Uncharacterized protein n=1 Tax=Penicilliopsis zonata CBS 506.65 TaxID=1073090 RepID=A0A1L9SLX7_9EURO|nr:hypothetical protein ASPZODRAFT_131696 [Penicilliopsis zonata CBS 506.65]OJJ48054.1 hypothetical protein ASPZODRAFT_131696 [Penicilliopsis zonata CBS 506.65]
MVNLAQRLSTGIGFTSEAIHAMRDRKKTASQPSVSPLPSYSEVTYETTDKAVYNSRPPSYHTVDERDEAASYDSYDENEAAWELDEMGESMRPENESDALTPTAATTSAFDLESVNGDPTLALVQMAGLMPNPVPKLPVPVIIPQRRPGNKDRGFVRAYAPVLEESGIGPDVFMQFLDTLDQQNKASQNVDVVNVATNMVGSLPEAAFHVTNNVLSVAAGAACEVQTHKTNSFLNRVNRDLFMPRGLFAMVMSFRDDTSATDGLVRIRKQNINHIAARYSHLDPASSRHKQGLRRLRSTSSQTGGRLELPESAPLVFPHLDRAAAQATTGDTTLTKLKGASAWVTDYFDRKAQAEFEAAHFGSALAVPEAEREGFKSRYNDPEHPANSGSLASLVTGGKIDTNVWRARKASIRRKKYQLIGLEPPNCKGAFGPIHSAINVGRAVKERKNRQKSGITAIAGNPNVKTFNKDVLYLLIMNLPSQEEVEDSTAQLEKAMWDLEQALGQQADHKDAISGPKLTLREQALLEDSDEENEVASSEKPAYSHKDGYNSSGCDEKTFDKEDAAYDMVPAYDEKPPHNTFECDEQGFNGDAAYDIKPALDEKPIPENESLDYDKRQAYDYEQVEYHHHALEYDLQKSKLSIRNI